MSTRRGKEPHPPEQARYARGIDLYCHAQYRQAASELAALSTRGDVLGSVARYYEAMSQRAMGIEALREGAFDAAERHLLAAVRLVGHESDLPGYLACVYAHTGRHGKCVAALERITDTTRGDPAAWRKLAQAQWRAGRRSEAYLTLAQALRQAGPEGSLYRQQALFYAAEEKYDQAREVMAAAVVIECSNPDAHFQLGLIEAAQGRVRAAVRCFQRALELQPGNVVLAYHLALAARGARQQGHEIILRVPEPSQVSADSEIRQLARYMTHEPAFLSAFMALPPSAVDNELFGVLAGVVQMALEEHPTYADLNYYCGAIFRRLGRPHLAMKYAQRAVRSNPRYVQGHLQVAELHADGDRRQEAARSLRQAIACGADYPDVHCTLGELLHRRAPEQARMHLNRALVLRPNYARAEQALTALAA